MRPDAWLLLAALVLPACTHAPAQPDPGTTYRSAQTERVTRAVGYFQHLQGLDRDGLQAEHERVAMAYAAAPTLDARIALILLLSHPRADFRDLDTALELIDDYLVGAAPGPDTDFVWLLEANVQAQRAYEEQLQATKVRSDQLQRQLDALKSIEQAIHAREMPE